MSRSSSKSCWAYKLLLKPKCYLSVFEGHSVKALSAKLFLEHCVIVQHLVQPLIVKKKKKKSKGGQLDE